MKNETRSKYSEFNSSILKDWINNGVNYVKVVAIEWNGPFDAFELIPNSEIPESGDLIHNIHSEDVLDMLEKMELVKFFVHEVYLEEMD